MGFGNNDNRKVVASAGTAVVLEADAHQVAMLVITSETDNTGFIAVGASTVVAAEGTQRGAILLAGDSLPPLFDVDLNKLYIDSTVSGDGVSLFWLE